jgi:hypothetical protein
MGMRPKILTPALLIVTLLACDAGSQTPPAAVGSVRTLARVASYQPSASQYAFVDSDAKYARLERAFPAPEGARRVDVADDSFGEWLRGLPLRTDRTTVHSYSGRKLNSPSAALVAIDVGERDLQQCADSAIRLHAEWLWSQGRTDELAYHFTSGDEVTYADWVDGERIRAVGSKVFRTDIGERDDDHASFREWMELVFRYAGTRSLKHDSKPVKPGDVRAGDFYVAPGSPGHAVVVLDVAKTESGRRIALLGQGFMPAQDFHVIRDDSAIDDVWFLLPDSEDETLQTPSWKPFSASDARRFRPAD